MRNTHTSFALLALLALFAPVSASAYLLPEEVLLNDDFYVPPAARDTRERVDQQSELSAIRRQQEQDAAFALQHPAAPEEENTVVETEEGTSRTLTEGDLELLRTIRLLERVDARQEVLSLLPQLHAGAPVMPNPLAPSGPGGVLAVMTMLGAVGWTLKRAGRKTGWTARMTR
ncbi:hypothetical protein COU80_01445 [Candidatus Peregrinibacteria bacterium CG10_big_fil_rev_8_21_14_0_10_55_24]|nr:MAG: hypothetical protein COU80_01445 [Candidatus Peregrinibacteria bacterium CG10_big_fil_rev_8_21_14_0_10_55_24]